MTANITDLASRYVDEFPPAVREELLVKIQTYADLDFERVKADLGDAFKYNGAIVEHAIWAALGYGFCRYVSSVNVEAAARKCRENGAQS